ncbi:peroxiredoxin-like family protein [Tunicatimonas pelagia]|uniref:peroxiredoxin-like family protein n=1 Tax=Tunicatimonas pelagia TaxID=931531 RepID=UPI0026652F3B|nr:peroxiredoxin-like family protein [Tunicatimonas pelagia]WKN41510.1 peroxiredoxin-like family protein [Tunicatimonas pelagia]
MTNLPTELEALSEEIDQQTAPQLRQVLREFVNSLQRQHASQRSLKVGDVASDFALKDQNQRVIHLYDQLKKGPIVLVFFRGGWCPFCNLTLQAWRHALPEIEFQGAQLLAVTPEAGEHVRRTVQKNKLDFSILQDKGSEVARLFKVSIALSDYLAAFYRSLGLNLLIRHQDTIARLPMPATYVIDTNCTIRYAFVAEDYTQRADISEVIEVLKQQDDKTKSIYTPAYAVA